MSRASYENSVAKWSLFLLCLIALSSCGAYRFGEGEFGTLCSTIEIPFIQGDKDGTLTQALVSEVTKRTRFSYKNCSARYLLLVKSVDVGNQNIGYRFDRNKQGQKIDALVPIESRITIQVEVSLIDQARNCTCLGPVILTEFVDFDHDYYNVPRGINIFSLGQINDFDSSWDVAIRPLSKKLARKIVDYLIEGW